MRFRAGGQHIPFQRWPSIPVSHTLALLDGVMSYVISHRRGFIITCALQGWATACAIVLYISYKRDNQRRDAFYGKPDPDATVDTSKLADKVGCFLLGCAPDLRSDGRPRCSGTSHNYGPHEPLTGYCIFIAVCLWKNSSAIVYCAIWC